MKDLAPPGWTRMPKPVSLSSHAIQDVSVGSSASMTRLVSVVRTFAVRFPVFVCMEEIWHRAGIASTHATTPEKKLLTFNGPV